MPRPQSERQLYRCRSRGGPGSGRERQGKRVVAVEGGKQAQLRLLQGKKKNSSGCLFPLPSQPLLLRLQLQLQADTNGALIATGNLSGGGSRACRRCWGPGGTPPLRAPYPLPAPILPRAPHVLAALGLSLSFTPPSVTPSFSSEDPLPVLFRWDLSCRTCPLGRGLLQFEIPLQLLE